MHCSETSRAFTLVEAVLVLAILSAAVVPVVTMYTASHRVAFSARRLTEVTLHAQDLLEALAELSVDEFPPVKVGQATTILTDGGQAAAGGSPRFAEVVAQFSKEPPVDMDRVVTAERLPSGELLLKIQVDWKAITGEAATTQHLVLPMLATPRNWQ